MNLYRYTRRLWYLALFRWWLKVVFGGQICRGRLAVPHGDYRPQTRGRRINYCETYETLSPSCNRCYGLDGLGVNCDVMFVNSHELSPVWPNISDQPTVVGRS
jgi:hypothetical protein